MGRNSAHGPSPLLESLGYGKELEETDFVAAIEGSLFTSQCHHPSPFAVLKTVLYLWQGSTLWTLAQPTACSTVWDKRDRKPWTQNNDLLPIDKITFPRGKLLYSVTKYSSGHGNFMLYMHLINFDSQYSG